MARQRRPTPSMNLDPFSATVDAIIARDPRFERDAYLFVRDALEFTTQAAARKSRSAPATPASATSAASSCSKACASTRLQQYGPMVPTVFEHWRVRVLRGHRRHRFQPDRGARIRKVRARYHRGFPAGVQFPRGVRRAVPPGGKRRRPNRRVARARSRPAAAARSEGGVLTRAAIGGRTVRLFGCQLRRTLSVASDLMISTAPRKSLRSSEPAGAIQFPRVSAAQDTSCPTA